MNNIEKLFLSAYDDYAAKILRHVYFRVNNKSLSEDLTSETFMKAWNYLREGNEVKNLKGFLYKIADNLVIDYYREKSHREISLDNVKETPDWGKAPSTAENFDKKVDIDLVKKHLNELPNDYKQILIHRFIDDLSIKEIKEITGKSMTNIYVMIHRGLKMLKEKIKNV